MTIVPILIIIAIIPKIDLKLVVDILNMIKGLTELIKILKMI